MTSPFKYRKKERKRLRAQAKQFVAAAEKVEREGTEFRSELAAILRRISDSNNRLARVKRRKKKSKLKTKTGGKSRH
jgi:predicted  nucleic acid-binding Zn-ribbon protein